MKTIDGLQQGSEAWHKFRAKNYRTASRASAMMGASPYQSRSDLLREIHTGLAQDFDAATLARFADGHKAEAAGREIAEKIIGEDLFPVTALSDDGYLSASFDGVTLLEDTIFECKLWSEEKAAHIKTTGLCPESDYWQVQQQLLVSGAEQALYMVTDGTEEKTRYCWVEPDAEAFERLTGGWQQFDADLDDYTPAAAEVQTSGRAPDDLPALRIEVTGQVTASNLDQYREHALAVFQQINTDLQSDQDFADAERTVKWCKEVEDRLKAAKEHALSQTESIDHLFKTIDSIGEEARRVRLDLDKQVKAQKEARRGEILNEAKQALREHVEQINATLGKARLPDVPADFAGAMKGLKTMSSLRDAADTELARAKIEANRIADGIRANLEVLRSEAKGYEALFADFQQLVTTKAPEDLKLLIADRIRQHKEAEAEREAGRKAMQEEIAARQNEEHSQQSAPEPTAAGERCSSAQPAPAAAERPADGRATLKLGDINARLAPLKLSTDAIRQLGIEPAGKEKAAVLYRERDFRDLCTAIMQMVSDAMEERRAA